MFTQIGLKILHYLYINRNTIFSLYKDIQENPNIKIDGKLNFAELLEYYKTIKKSGLKVSDDDLLVPVGQDDVIEIEENTHKNLVEYNQI